MNYRHTQMGYFLIVPMAGIAMASLVWGNNAVAFGFAVVGFLFSSLTVVVDRESIRIWFGPGLIRKQFKIQEIETCQAAKFRCYSWGIHGWPGKCWLYNVSGFQSIELKMKSGMKYYIGTDEPLELAKAIEGVMSQPPEKTD
jgi:hypothetical protein